MRNSARGESCKNVPVRKTRGMRLARLVLAGSALPFLAIGLAFLVAPQELAAHLGVALINATADNDARAVYGGLELACGALLALAAGSVAWRLGFGAGTRPRRSSRATTPRGGSTCRRASAPRAASCSASASPERYAARVVSASHAIAGCATAASAPA